MATILRIGSLLFEPNARSLGAINRAEEYTWNRVERAGMAPAKQFGGEGDSTLTITGTVYLQQLLSSSPQRRRRAISETDDPDEGDSRQGQNVLATIEEIRKLALSGAPQMVVTGYGRILGLWVIERVTENQNTMLSNGVPTKQEYTIELSKYTGDA